MAKHVIKTYSCKLYKIIPENPPTMFRIYDILAQNFGFGMKNLTVILEYVTTILLRQFSNLF